jgi:hypothetical protein
MRGTVAKRVRAEARRRFPQPTVRVYDPRTGQIFTQGYRRGYRLPKAAYREGLPL